MRPELDIVLQCLSVNGYSVSSLISDILTHGSNWEDRRIKCLLEGVEQDAVDICTHLLNYNTTSTSVSTWALDVTLHSQARNGHGPHFMTSHPLYLLNSDAVVSPGLSFGSSSTPTNPPQDLLNIGRARFVKYKRVIIIDPLPDDVFLEIFDLCLCDFTEYLVQRMRKWLILVHVCQRWRRIIFASPCRLDLYLSCIRGTPVKQNLVYWPLSLPLVIEYPGRVSSHDPTPSDDDSIVAALTHTGRIHRANIHAPSSLFRKVANVMQESFPVLTHLELTWDQKDLTDPLPLLPRGFLGGSAPRLEYLYLRRVSFPSFPTLLSSARNLLELRLSKILHNITPETMVAGLAVLTRLSTLSIEFDRETHQTDRWESRSNPPMPTILPALTEFQYKGYSAYLEDLLALINTPLVDNICIQYFVEQIQVPPLSRFIGRTKNLKDAQFRRAYVIFFNTQFDIELESDFLQGESSLANIALTLLGRDIQVPYMVGVLGQLTAIFSNVRHLGGWLEWGYMDDLDDNEWLLFFRLFPAVETLHLSGDVPCIASALENIAEDMLTEVMPALHLMCLDEGKRTGDEKPVRSIERFLSLRQLSGHPVTVVNTRDEFNKTLDENPRRR